MNHIDIMQSQSPFSKLARKHIQDIFSLCATSCFQESRAWFLAQSEDVAVDANSHSDPTSWVAISHVCKYWRYLALDTPHLWENIIVSDISYLKACIVRSKSRHISLFFDDWKMVTHDVEAVKKFRSRVMQLTFLHIARICDLTIRINYRSTQPIQQPRTDVSRILAPVLEKLESGCRIFVPFTTAEMGEPLSSWLTKTQMPRLRLLKVSDSYGYIPCQWSESHFPQTLTSQTLRVTSDDWGSPSTFRQTLNVLHNLPYLIDLNLSQVLLEADHDYLLRINRKLLLPCLRSLRLRDVTNSCLALLGSIVLQPTVTVTLILPPNASGGQPDTGLPNTSSVLQNSGIVMLPRSARVEAVTSHAASYATWKSEPSEYSKDVRGFFNNVPPDYHAKFFHQHTYNSHSGICLSDILPFYVTFSFSTVVTLCIGEINGVEIPADILRFMCNLSNVLRHLRLVGLSAVNIFTILDNLCLKVLEIDTRPDTGRRRFVGDYWSKLGTTMYSSWADMIPKAAEIILGMSVGILQIVGY
ncbi:hypothetical protein C8Q75DRAFT_377011 [Abortiporus biennis]|nr:hypothetical protein C8Q75DRAFT_377011 [Abortiporus biennis]